MSGLWEFIKRNRGKIAFGAIVVGGSILVQQTLLNSIKFSKYLSHETNIQDHIQLKARRQYIFDSNHRTCDRSLTELVADVAKRVAFYFDVESVVQSLKTELNLSDKQKIEKWQEIKVLAIGRIVALAYVYTLLTLTLKCQMSMLASEICDNFSPVQENSWWKYLPFTMQLNNFNSLLSSKSNIHINAVDASCHHVFLKCCQYFTTQGMEELMKRIISICRIQLEELDLRTMVTSNDLRDILSNVKRRMELLDCRHFSYLIIPKRTNQNGFTKLNTEKLDALLNRLIEMLESTKCRETSSALLDIVLEASIDFVKRKSDSRELPLVSILPLIAKSFDSISRNGFDSPIQNMLCSAELHEFTKHVFCLPSI